MFHVRERRKERQNETAYAALILTPDVLGSIAAGGDLDTFPIPANAEIAYSFDQAVDAEEITFDLSGRIFVSPALAANQIQKLGWLEKSKDLVITGTGVGNITLYLVVKDLRFPIATGEFT